MNGNTKLPLKKWKAEHSTLTANKENLYRDYYKLRDDVREAETVKREVERIVNSGEQFRKWRGVDRRSCDNKNNIVKLMLPFLSLIQEY